MVETATPLLQLAGSKCLGFRGGFRPLCWGGIIFRECENVTGQAVTYKSAVSHCKALTVHSTRYLVIATHSVVAAVLESGDWGRRVSKDAISWSAGCTAP